MKEEDKLAVRTQNDTGASRQIDKQTEYLNKYICVPINLKRKVR